MDVKKIIALIKAKKLTFDELAKLCKLANENVANDSHKAWAALAKSIDWQKMPLPELRRIYKSRPNWKITQTILKTKRLTAKEMLEISNHFDDDFDLWNALIQSGKLSSDEIISIIVGSSDARVFTSGKKQLPLAELSNRQLLKLLSTSLADEASRKEFEELLTLNTLKNADLIKLAEEFKENPECVLVVKNIDFSVFTSSEIISLGETLENETVWDLLMDTILNQK